MNGTTWSIKKIVIRLYVFESESTIVCTIILYYFIIIKKWKNSLESNAKNVVNQICNYLSNLSGKKKNMLRQFAGYCALMVSLVLELRMQIFWLLLLFSALNILVLSLKTLMLNEFLTFLLKHNAYQILFLFFKFHLYK